MSLHIKLLIPILQIGLKKENFSKESGFIDAYIDRSEFTSSLCLLYDADIISNNKPVTFEKHVVHSYITVNNHCYELYKYTVHDKKLQHCFDSICFEFYERNNILKILKFWNFEDGEINERVYINCNNISINKHVKNKRDSGANAPGPLYFFYIYKYIY